MAKNYATIYPFGFIFPLRMGRRKRSQHKCLSWSLQYACVIVCMCLCIISHMSIIWLHKCQHILMHASIIISILPMISEKTNKQTNKNHCCSLSFLLLLLPLLLLVTGAGVHSYTCSGVYVSAWSSLLSSASHPFIQICCDWKMWKQWQIITRFVAMIISNSPTPIGWFTWINANVNVNNKKAFELAQICSHFHIAIKFHFTRTLIAHYPDEFGNKT